jgi:enoyl-CoA hydratase/carnithine racemase
MMSEHIEVTKADGINTIRMNRADKKNAITRAMYGAMAAALQSGDADEAIRCHVILGVPGAFSAGNDMADFMVVATGGDGGTEVIEFLVALATAAKPVVSGVDGIAVGVGTTIQFHCDVSYATPRTQFRTPFVDLGIVPEAGSSLLGPAMLGRQRAFAMLALGEGMSAEEAVTAGFIRAVVGEDELEAKTMEAARVIAAKPPEAMRLARDLLLGDRKALVERIVEEAKIFRARLKSDETRQALMAFMNRKKG